MSSSKDVTAYIAAADPKARPMLKQLRATIRAAAPQAEEKMSYGMPYYGYHGRLMYFAAFRAHVSVFPMMSATTRAKYATQLKPYLSGKVTLRVPLDAKLPLTLIRRLVVARYKESAVQARNK